MSHASRITHHVLRPALPCLIAFVLLVPTLDAQSLWWDEGISLHLTTLPWREIIADRAANIHPPLYFFALKMWVGLVGATPFAARYLSALAATLLPAAVYAFVQRRFNRRAGRGAALLVALAPPFVIYGQEMRAYAFLPLLAIALLAQVWPKSSHKTLASDQCVASLRDNPTLLALTQVAFVLTHYAGVFAVAWANVALLIQLVRRRDRHAWRQWGLATGLTALLVLPWSVAVLLAGAGGLKTEAGLGNALAESVPFDYLARLLGIFHTTGIPGAMADPLLARPSALVGILLLIALFWCGLPWGRARFGNRGYSLLAAWLLPLATAAMIWLFSPQAHPRYVLPFALGGWLLAAVLTTMRAVPHWLRGALLAAVLATSLLGIYAYFTDPAYARSDVRGIAALIRADAAPGDVALVPHTDWSLAAYDIGAARLVMVPAPADDAAVAALLAREIAPDSHVYLLDYRRNALDPRGQIRAALAWGGWFESRDNLHGVFVERYTLASRPAMPDCTPISPVCVQGQSPCVTGAAIQPGPVSGAALPVTLCWDGAPAAGRYAAALRLYAQSGALVAGADAWLLDAALRTTELWSSAPVTTYHRVSLPVGLLPRAYRLEVGVYPVEDAAAPLSLVRAGASPVPALVLGEIIPAAAPWVDDPVNATQPGSAGEIEVLPGLRLQSVDLHSPIIYPGQPLFVTLRWRVDDENVVVTGQLLVLRQGEHMLATTPLLTGLSPMPTGRALLEHAVLIAPPDVDDGPVDVVLLSGDRQIVIGEVTLRAGEHTFVAPPVAYPVEAQTGDVATLLGLDVEPELSLRPGEPFTVTLVWRAEAGAAKADLTVFAHLIGADGGIVAQHDGKPVGGTRPTSGWLAEEIIVDAHTLVWKRDYAGPATLRIGLYDAVTGERILWEGGGDAWTVDASWIIGQ